MGRFATIIIGRSVVGRAERIADRQPSHQRCCASNSWRGRWQGICVHGTRGPSTTRTKVCFQGYPHSPRQGPWPPSASRSVVLLGPNSNFCIVKASCGIMPDRPGMPVARVCEPCSVLLSLMFQSFRQAPANVLTSPHGLGNRWRPSAGVRQHQVTATAAQRCRRTAVA